MTVAELSELAEHASPEAVALARAVLEQDLADRAWAEQVGTALAQRDVARLLGKTEQAVTKDRRLLRLRNRDDRPVYPVMQFEGRRLVDGVDQVIDILDDAVHPLTIASWLTGANPALGERRPIDALRDGDREQVITVARRLAHSAG